MNPHHTATPHRGDALAWERGVIAIRTCIHVCAYSALHYTAFHYIEYNTFHYTTLHCGKLHYTSLHHIAVHFATLHYTFTTATLPYIALHFITARPLRPASKQWAQCKARANECPESLGRHQSVSVKIVIQWESWSCSYQHRTSVYIIQYLQYIQYI